MPDTTVARKWAKIGFLFQGPMIAAFTAQLALFHAHRTTFLVSEIISDAGALLFVWCLWFLYIKKARLTGLITSGPYRYTRHPMYIGLLVMNIADWGTSSFVWHSWEFLILELVFVAGMIVAGYCQERETVERFGQEAIDFYARTPRLPFFFW
jgi:protein-S-isoprenylcysteine O-methyltransferase Ste14